MSHFLLSQLSHSELDFLSKFGSIYWLYLWTIRI